MRYSFAYLIVLLVLCASACKKRIIEPVVPTGDRVVLIEEFTGKGCTNCPKGSRELENLLNIYQDQLVVVSIHANYFADPAQFPLGQYDLRTDEGEVLFDFLGPIFGFPTAAVNRRPETGGLQQPVNAWAGLVAQEIQEDPEVEFTIDADFAFGARLLDLNVEGRAKNNISDEVRISVMIAESGIVDAQDVFEEGGIVEDYVHNHVLRDMLTAYDGDILAPSLASAEEFDLHFSYTLSEQWVPENCNVIVFISVNKDNGDFHVLQAGEAHVVD